MNNTTINFKNFLVQFNDKISTMPTPEQMSGFGDYLQSITKEIDQYNENPGDIKRIFILQNMIIYVNFLNSDQQNILFNMIKDYLLHDLEIIIELEQVLYNSCIEIKHEGMNKILQLQEIIIDNKAHNSRSFTQALSTLRIFINSITSVDNMHDLKIGLVEFYHLSLKQENNQLLNEKLKSILTEIMKTVSKFHFKDLSERGAQIKLCHKFEKIIQEISEDIEISESKLNVPSKSIHIVLPDPFVGEKNDDFIVDKTINNLPNKEEIGNIVEKQKMEVNYSQEKSSINFPTFFKKLLKQNPNPKLIQDQNLVELKKF